MLPSRRRSTMLRFVTLLVTIGSTLASVLIPGSALAQTSSPDLIHLVIPAGAPARADRLPPLPATSAPKMMVRPGALVKVATVDAPPALITVAPQPNAVHTLGIHATELHGLLPHANDRHYFGLESIQPGDAFALTLTVEPASALQDGVSVNFVVLSDSGLQRFLQGADPLAVKVALGTPMLFDQVGNRLTALVPGSTTGDYTVIVFNNGRLPLTYTLQAQGGLLRDDAGQTFGAVTVDPVEGAIIRRGKPQSWANATLLAAASGFQDAPPVQPVAVADLLVERPGGTGSFVESLPVRWTEPVRARRLSGTLLGSDTQHFFALAAEGSDEEILLTLQLPPGAPSRGAGFWVMTQDGVRSMVLGGLPQELNLAAGIAHPSAPGRYEARLRLARPVLYTVVLYHQGDLPTNYALSVQGGVLVDQYGQTNEAYAAAIEVWALTDK